MLDDLLGRTALKDRIAELESERDSLEARLEAEGERRADAVSARQSAEERINRLEDRIADLEGQLEGSERRDVVMGFRHEESIRSRRLDEVIDRLSSFQGIPESICSAYVDEKLPDGLRELLGERSELVSRARPCLVFADDAGMLATALRVPVAPDPFYEWGSTPRIDRSWLRPTGRHTLALVRADVFALGIYEDDQRVEFQGFESEVMGRHSKGGYSQARFERLREEQIDEHIEACVDALGDTPDPLYVVGDRRLVGAFDDRPTATAAVDATGDPEDALDDAFEDFWTVRLFGL